jgi:D-alanyl-D-alanine dipeptidase
VDLGLVDLKTGKPVPMPSGYDEFTVRAYPSWPGGSSEQRRNRELLRRTMEAEGFRIFHTEWWHYDLKSWKEFPAGNRDFDAIPAK